MKVRRWNAPAPVLIRMLLNRTFERLMMVGDQATGPSSGARPFTWTKTADEILKSLAGYLAKVGTGRRIYEQD
jgi:hypothetical protein